MRRVLTVIALTVLLMLGALASTAAAQDEYDPEVGGTTVVEDPGGKGKGSLPFTGSTGTSTYVLFGLAIIALGGVLVVAGRRREDVLTRS